VSSVASDSLSAVDVGFYGKLPSHGDFLRRRVPDGFVNIWDPWLQECLLESRTALGERWLDVYLTSPLWRFACAPGVLGEHATLGLMAPSVDRVGRYFHLTLVAPLPAGVDPVLAVLSSAAFFARADQLALETLAADRIDFEEFDRQVLALGSTLENLSAAAASTEALGAVLENGATRWRLGVGESSNLAATLQLLAADRLRSIYEPLTVLWTDGSRYVEPSLLIGRGLPAPDSFAALLTGAWSPHGWHSLAPPTHSGDSDTVELPLFELPPPRYRSAGASDVGKARTVNQDAFLQRPDAGVWVVADGLGGHAHGEVASRMVCDALADFLPSGTLEETVHAAGGRVQQVNTMLRQETERSGNAAITGSTVVALLTRGSHYAVFWAGDSRLYRWRSGVLEQLTVDHSAEELDAAGRPTSAISRAVGAEADLVLDLSRGRVLTGDRFLLCSDGLSRILPLPTIEACLTDPDPDACARALIAATLQAGAPDNVTVVVVDAEAQPEGSLDIGL
jgi:type VI secretion system protein ImpM